MTNLQPHQEAALKYFISSPNRGMLLLHQTGSGKTRTAIAIAEYFKYYKEVLVLAGKSLHDNFRKELRAFSKNIDADRYRFVSSNANNMIDKLETNVDDITGINVKSLNLNNKMVIIDEAHNLFVSMANGSKNATALYDMLMAAKNCRILLLTASGIINTIYEVVPALNICKGPIFTEDGERITLLPESSEDFTRYFIDEKNMRLKNTDKLANRIHGLVSYTGDLFNRKVFSFYEMLSKTLKKENYPDRLPIKVELISMSSQQYGAYEQMREKERLETRNSIVGKGEKVILSQMWGGNSNLDITIPKEEMIDANNIIGGELRKSSMFKKSTSYRIRSRQVSNIYNAEGEDINAKIEIYAPKIKAIGDKIKPGLKTLIYSNFVKAGINPMCSYLEHIGYKRFDPNNKNLDDSILGYYGIYSGEVSPEDRTATLKAYNEDDSPVNILLISSSGAEGLSTKNTRVIHIMEPYWNVERLLQVIARGIRYKSHETLPEKERNVQVHIYLAVPPKDVKPTEKSTDVYLFTEAARKYEINSQMIQLMARVAIDCEQFNQGQNFQCHKCEPKNGAPAYLNDLNKDMQYPSPCKASDAPLNVKEIKLNGSFYYVSEDKKVFVKNEDEYIEILDVDIKNYILSSVK